MAAERNSAMQMVLHMAEMVGWLRKGMGEMVRQAGLHLISGDDHIREQQVHLAHMLFDDFGPPRIHSRSAMPCIGVALGFALPAPPRSISFSCHGRSCYGGKLAPVEIDRNSTAFST
jgi:hypothetical protein